MHRKESKSRRRAAPREDGLQRVDDQLNYFSTWPVASMINQKNYYTEYLKRDDQILVLRLQNEENRNRLARAARDRDRALAQPDQSRAGFPNAEHELDETLLAGDTPEEPGDSEVVGSKVVIIHPGSQNLRIGLASDALPKTIPMVVARKCRPTVNAQLVDEPITKRRKLSDTSSPESDSPVDQEFAAQVVALSTELKGRMRKKGRRIVPNSKEVAGNFNRRSAPSIIHEHNDTQRIDWTDISSSTAAEYYTGHAALRVPDPANPQYKLSWPIRYGTFNQSDYASKEDLLLDFSVVIEDAMTTQLGLTRRKEWSQYGCVFVVPDLYDRQYVTTILDVLFGDFGFGKVSFLQESLSGSFGAGYSTCVIVDVGAQKTSICCVDEGMCVEQSRINLRYGGADVTETFVRMLLTNHFPYRELDLNRRHDFLLAEELKSKFCTLQIADIIVSSHDFNVRAFGQDTRLYSFKTYDEVMLAVMGYYNPEIFDNSLKLVKRHQLFGRSRDLYDGTPNNPISSAQLEMFGWAQKKYMTTSESSGILPTSPIPTESMQNESQTTINGQSTGRPLLFGLQEASEGLRPPGVTTPAPSERETMTGQESNMDEEAMDRILPCMPINEAIMLSIHHGAKGDERKMRDFFGGIIPIGGGAQTPGFNALLEEELSEAQPRFRKELLVGPPPREIDPQVLVWKGASVFGKLQATNDSWISTLEYDRLGSRVLAYKCLWSW